MSIEDKSPWFISVGGRRVYGEACVRVQPWGPDRIEVIVSNGRSSMGCDITAKEARALAAWVLGNVPEAE